MPLWQEAARGEGAVAVRFGSPGSFGAAGLAVAAGRTGAGAGCAVAADENDKDAAKDAAIVVIATRIPNEEVRIILTSLRDRKVARFQYYS
jgi:hypothetical protein